MLEPQITLDGLTFRRLTRRVSGVAMYRGDGCYLRIGEAVVAEAEVHRWMLERGFPVAGSLQMGRHRGQPYLVEESLPRRSAISSPASWRPTAASLPDSWSLVDDTFSSAGWGRPSRWLDELLVCRAAVDLAVRPPSAE